MNRKEFIKTMGLGTGAVVFATCLGACSGSDDPAPNKPGGDNVDFSFDVTTDTNLNNNGWTIKDGVIIARSGSDYLAYQSTCTHEGNPLTYNASNNTFPCSLQTKEHGSIFDSNGNRIAGPAPSNLRKYKTQLAGNILRVYT